MCVDIFAPGHPITIEFLHERLYFVPGPNGMEVFECCDAYIKNDDLDHDIKTLRVQIPHYVEWSPDLGEAQNIRVNTYTQRPSEPPLWYGRLAPTDDGRKVEHDPDSRPGYTNTKRYTARLHQGEFRQPPETGSWREYSRMLQELSVTVLNLDLTPTISSGELGLLRLEVKPTPWAPDFKGWPWWSELKESSPFGGTSAFMARATINSPELLRDDLHARLTESGNEWLVDPIVERGWKKDNTLVRILDHRVSLVFPSFVRLSHLVTSVEPRPLLAMTPFHIWEDADPQPPKPADRPPDRSLRFVQGFMAGSVWNSDTDLVSTVGRIGNYIDTLPKLPERHDGTAPTLPSVPPNQRQPTPRPMFDLVSKFGGGLRQEHVGTLVRQMVIRGFLKEVRPSEPSAARTTYDPTAEDSRVYVPVEDQTARYQALLRLRNVYTFPERAGLKDEERKHLKSFLDLHPFSISFTANWELPNEQQEQARQRLIQLVGDEPKLHNFNHPRLKPHPRRAVVVVCPESPHPDFKDHPYPQLVGVGKRLANVLKVLGQFEVSLLSDPELGEQITDAIIQALGNPPAAGSGGFLFWFLGHGRGNSHDEDNVRELELFHRKSQHQGLNWTVIRGLLSKFPHVPKAVVLNCCEAGLARRHPPQNTDLWTVSRANDTTRVATTVGGDDCFTHLVCQQLLEGLPAERERAPLALRDVLNAAQESLLASQPHSKGAAGFRVDEYWKSDTEVEKFVEFAHNLYRYDILPPQLLDRLRKQILDGHHGGTG